jgi:hypothetical protein
VTVPEATHRSPWLTWIPLVVGALSIITYAVVIALEVGSMRGQINLTTARVEALEQRGSGPVQQSAERVAQIQARVDRILTELLDMQRRISDIASTQARDGQKLEHLRTAPSP